MKRILGKKTPLALMRPKTSSAIGGSVKGFEGDPRDAAHVTAD